MFDQPLRPFKDRCLEPVARTVRAVPPLVLTGTAMLACVGAGVAAASELTGLSVALWLIGRLVDGLDGAVARVRGTASDLGGYLDQLADTVGYAAVPIGLAAASPHDAAWPMAAVLLATFYVNTVSWTYLSALAEKRAAGASQRGESTSIHMPSGLVEGAETIVAFTVMLAVPSWTVAGFGVMSAAVAVTIVQRITAARRMLR